MSLTPENKQRIKNVNDALKERGIRWPKTDEWQDESLGKRKKMQEIFSVLQARDFHEQSTVDALLDKFGVEKWAQEAKAAADAATKEANGADDAGAGEKEEEDLAATSSPSKRKREEAAAAEDLSALSIKELKARLTALGETTDGCIEKSDMITKLQDRLAQTGSASSPPSAATNEKAAKKPRKKKEKTEEETKQEPKEPKVLKKDTFVVEANRLLGDTVQEFADLYVLLRVCVCHYARGSLMHASIKPYHKQHSLTHSLTHYPLLPQILQGGRGYEGRRVLQGRQGHPRVRGALEQWKGAWHRYMYIYIRACPPACESFSPTLTPLPPPPNTHTRIHTGGHEAKGHRQGHRCCGGRAVLTRTR